MLGFNLLMMASAVAALPFNATRMLERQTAATVYSQCTQPGVVALTWDDGPYTWNNDIVGALNSFGVKGTFFFNGNNFQCIYNPDNVARIQNAYASGHQIASHTWSHVDLTTLDAAGVTSEFDRVDAALQEIIGVTPAFVRPPFGSYNEIVSGVAGSRGQSLALWSFDSGDATGATASQVMASYDSLVASHPDSVIALNHETYETSAHEVLQHILSLFSGAGYRFVTMAECVGAQPYNSVGTPKTTGGGSC